MPATKFELKMGGATRAAFGKALVELGRENPNVVVCDADLSKSTNTAGFAKEFPERFFLLRYCRSEHGGHRRRPGVERQGGVCFQLLLLCVEQGL